MHCRNMGINERQYMYAYVDLERALVGVGEEVTR